jgi:LacI family transcriptional regulator
VKEKRRATILDVARQAGVGTTTVSRVINGGKLVAPALRMRVEAVIRQLGYQPNHAAQSLAQERSNSIGLIVPRLDTFFSTIVSVAQDICRANQHILLIATSLDMEEQALEELKVFERQRVDGLIVTPPANQSSLFQNYCRQLSERIVTVDLPMEGGGISSVLTNNAEAAADAARHLIAHDRKRILFLVSNPLLHTMRERRRGYTEAIAEKGLKPIISQNISSFETAETAILEAFKTGAGIDGIMTANDTLGIYAFQVLQKHKISIPSQVGFITFDDFALADTLRPGVTCVAQPLHELGRVATELLLAQLKSTRTRNRKIELPSRLIVRESCGCKRGK